MYNMTKKPTTVIVDANSDNNAPVYDYAIEMKGMVQDWREAEKAGSKREGAIGHAGFRLARILVNDLLPQGGEYSVLRKHTPEAFFTSDEVRKVWKSPEVLLSFVDEKANDDADLTGKVRSSWSRTVELAFTIWACQRHFAKATGPQVDMAKCLVPAAAFLAAHDKWPMVYDNEDGKLMLVTFGTRTEEVLGKDKAKKNNSAVALKFIPSVSAFNALRGAWLDVAEQRSKRDRANSKSNEKASTATVTVTATAAPELLTKAFSAVTEDGKAPSLPAFAKDAKGHESIGNMLYAIMTNMAINDPDFLRGVIVDAVHDDNAGNALRAMLATILNDAASADAVNTAEAATA